MYSHVVYSFFHKSSTTDDLYIKYNISLWNPVSIKALVHVGLRNINFIEYTCIKYKKVIFKLLFYILTIENIHRDSKIYDPNSVIKADHLVNTCKSAPVLMFIMSRGCKNDLVLQDWHRFR